MPQEMLLRDLPVLRGSRFHTDRVGFLIEEIESWIAQKRRDRAPWDPSGQHD
jgi:hypothetical protein